MPQFKVADIYAEMSLKDQRYRAAMSRTHAGIKKTNTMLGGLLKSSALASVGVGVLFYKAVQGAMNFEKSMARVSTMLTGKGMEWMPKYSKGIDKMSRDFGESTEVLADGLYNILSASVDPAKAMGVLQVATEAAKGGFTDTAVAVDGITSVLNAYRMEADKAGEVSDKMAMTVKRGKITFEQLSGVIGTIAPSAKAAGESLDTVLGMIASLTKQGISPDRAATQIVSMLKQAAKEGLTLTQLIEKYRGKNLSQILGSVADIRAAKGIAALSGSVKDLKKDIGAMSDSAGARLEAFEKYQDTFSYKWEKAKQATFSLVRALGSALLPILTPLVEGLAAVVSGIVDLVNWVRDLLPQGNLLGSVFKYMTLSLVGFVAMKGPLLMMLKGVGIALSALAAHPVVAVVAGLALLAAALADALIPGEKLADKIDYLSGKLGGFKDKLKSAFGTPGEGINRGHKIGGAKGGGAAPKAGANVGLSGDPRVGGGGIGSAKAAGKGGHPGSDAYKGYFDGGADFIMPGDAAVGYSGSARLGDSAAVGGGAKAVPMTEAEKAKAETAAQIKAMADDIAKATAEAGKAIQAKDGGGVDLAAGKAAAAAKKAKGAVQLTSMESFLGKLMAGGKTFDPAKAAGDQLSETKTTNKKLDEVKAGIDRIDTTVTS